MSNTIIGKIRGTIITNTRELQNNLLKDFFGICFVEKDIISEKESIDKDILLTIVPKVSKIDITEQGIKIIDEHVNINSLYSQSLIDYIMLSRIKAIYHLKIKQTQRDVNFYVNKIQKILKYEILEIK